MIAATLLSGCLLVGQSGGQAAPSVPPVPTTPAAAQTPTPSPAESTAHSSGRTPVTRPLPAGLKWVELRTQGVKFAVPESWTEVDPAVLNQLGEKDKQAFKQMADAAGVPIDEYIASAAKSSLRFVAAPPVNGFSDNINVVAIPFKGVPSASMVEPQLKAFGATIDSSTTTTVPYGKVLIVKYTLTTADRFVSHRLFAVGTGETGLAFSITSASSSNADAYLARLSDTLSDR